MSRWEDLELPWQCAFEDAIDAYLCRGSLPVGAVVTDDRGAVVARGANNFAASRLAHAELAALSTIPADANRTMCELFSTLEPCLMCVGAIRLAQIRAVHFGARDPVAGATNLLNSTEFMQQFPCKVHPPTHEALERAVVALIVESRERTGHRRWRKTWNSVHPVSFSLGMRLVSIGAHARWSSSRTGAKQVYDELAAL